MNIKILREKRKLTQQEVAEKMNVGQSTVAMWETGQSFPRADKLKLLSEILGCTVDDLLSEQKGA